MAINNSSVCIAAPELAAGMTGSFVKIGTLVEAPVVIIFDNQSTTASIAISVDGGITTWRTFPAGEALVLDMRANSGLAPNFCFAKGTTFFGNGTAGTFSISYVYAQNQ